MTKNTPDTEYMRALVVRYNCRDQLMQETRTQRNRSNTIVVQSEGSGHLLGRLLGEGTSMICALGTSNFHSLYHLLPV